MSKKAKFKRIGGRRKHLSHSAKKRLRKRKEKWDLKTKEKQNVNNQLNQMNISPTIITQNDPLSKFSPNRINFLVSKRDDALDDFF